MKAGREARTGTSADPGERRNPLRRLIRSASACLALAAVIGGAEPSWDWLPRAADNDQPCELHLAADALWSIADATDVAVSRQPGQIVAVFEPRRLATLSFTGPGDARMAVRLLPPGKAAGMTADADGRLRLGGDAVLLSVPRCEASEDRRWRILRLWTKSDPQPCSLRLGEPASLAEGLPVLTRQIAAAQAIDPAQHGVLIELGGDDRLAGWKHREYRQALAWLLSDLTARGATRLVLVEPACAEAEERLLAPLRAQIRDVSTAFKCATVDTTGLGEHRWWEVSPGVLGRQLNAAGRAERERLLAPWLAVR